MERSARSKGAPGRVVERACIVLLAAEGCPNGRLTGDAARRAAELDKRHLQNDTLVPDNNPSSGMHRLRRAGCPADSAVLLSP
jgi:hypothetical protein